MLNKKIILGILTVISVIVGVLFVVSLEKKVGKYDQFAQCLKERGAKFYGAFWCPHCQNQKKLFEGAYGYLDYIECSTPDGKGQLDICNQESISSYPTWKFADGSVVSGEMSLSDLAQKTGCSLP